MSAPERREPQSEPTRDSRPPSVAPLLPCIPLAEVPSPRSLPRSPPTAATRQPLPTPSPLPPPPVKGDRPPFLFPSFSLSILSIPRALPPFFSLSKRSDYSAPATAPILGPASLCPWYVCRNSPLPYRPLFATHPLLANPSPPPLRSTLAAHLRPLTAFPRDGVRVHHRANSCTELPMCRSLPTYLST